MITVDTLREWSARICTMAHGGREEAARLLDVEGPLVPGRDASAATQPPAGAAAMSFYDDLETRSELAFVDLVLVAPGFSLAQLNAGLGPGRALPQVHWNSPVQVVFPVKLDGQPSSCDVIAEFRGGVPTDESATTRLTLRRNLFNRKPR